MFIPAPTIAELGDFGDQTRYSLLHWGMFPLTPDEWALHCRMGADWDMLHHPGECDYYDLGLC